MRKWLLNQFKMIAENLMPILETFALLGCIYVPIDFDFKSFFSKYLQESTPTPDNFLSLFLFSLGNLSIGFAFFVTLLLRIRSYNVKCLLNRGHAYHEYSYCWYLYCAYLLGYKKCNLCHVPIYMQFKLAIRNTFDEYPLLDWPFSKDDKGTVVEKWVFDPQEGIEYNIILEDTYPIADEKVLRVKPGISTLKISRSESPDLSRYYSPQFIQSAISQVQNLPEGAIVNIFATTNPKHTLEIARGAFQMAGRGNVSHLFVFQQGERGAREFKAKGYKIF